LTVDGLARQMTVDTRTTLLDALRERLGIISPKRAAITVSAGRARSVAVLRELDRGWPSHVTTDVAARRRGPTRRSGNG
jgi:xanthine dehydrogenase YagT iron-sulfur-binding subunit